MISHRSLQWAPLFLSLSLLILCFLLRKAPLNNKSQYLLPPNNSSVCLCSPSYISGLQIQGSRGSLDTSTCLSAANPTCAHFLPSQAVPPSYPPELWVPSWTPPLSDHSGFHFLSVYMHTILFIPPATPEVLASPLTWGFLPRLLPSLPIFYLSLFYPLQPCLMTLLRNAKSNHPRPQNPSVVH